MMKHYWNGSILTVESDSGSSAADLKGPKGETGPRGPRGLKGERGGGAAIEDGIISTETTWSSAAIMDNFAEYMSVEGNPVQCEPIPNMPLHVLTSFEPKQEGSGNPYPAGGGKQLYDVNSRTSTYSGLSVDNDDWVTIEIDNTNGTGETYGSIYTPISTALKTNNPYAIVSEIKEITAESNIQIIGGTTTSNKSQFTETYARTGAGTRVTVQTTRSSFDGCKTMLRTNYIIPAGIKGKVVFRISVLEDTTITADNFVYQPYSNIRPIVGYDSINLTRCGKNLLPEWEQGSISNSTGIEADANAVIRSGWAAVVPGTTYTVSRSINGGSFAVRGYDADKNYIGVGSTCITLESGNTADNPMMGIAKTATFTVKDGCYYLRFIDYTNDLTSKYQLETGSTATDYEPFKGDTFTFALGSTYYGGMLDWNTGTLTTEYGCIAEYAGETISGEYISSTGGLHTGSQIVYELSELKTIQLTPQEIKAIKGINTLSTNADNLQVIGRVDTMKQLSELAARVAALEKKLGGE